MTIALAACAPASDYERVADGTAERWSGPYHWHIDAAPETEARWRPAIEAHLAELQELTGLDIREADEATANVAIVLKPWTDIYEEVKLWRPVVGRRWSPDYDGCFLIRFPNMGIAFISTSQASSAIGNCIPQELTQLTGLFGDMDGRRDTVFSSQSLLPRLTEGDREIVRRHYGTTP